MKTADSWELWQGAAADSHQRQVGNRNKWEPWGTPAAGWIWYLPDGMRD